VTLPEHEDIKDRLLHALQQSDIVGVHFLREDTPDLDLYTRPARIVSEMKAAGLLDAHLCSANIHRDLQLSGYLDLLLRGRRRLGIISCRPLQALIAEKFEIPDVFQILIPEEVARSKNFSGTSHYPDRFTQIQDEIKIPVPGTIFLVAGGVLAKIYCAWIKEKGGIAIDIGSIVDGWVGLATRSYLRIDPSDSTSSLHPAFLLNEKK